MYPGFRFYVLMYVHYTHRIHIEVFSAKPIEFVSKIFFTKVKFIQFTSRENFKCIQK